MLFDISGVISCDTDGATVWLSSCVNCCDTCWLNFFEIDTLLDTDCDADALSDTDSLIELDIDALRFSRSSLEISSEIDWLMELDIDSLIDAIVLML